MFDQWKTWTRDPQYPNGRWYIIRKYPKCPQNFQPNCLPKPKSLVFSEKNSRWVSIVRGIWYSWGKFELIHNGNLSKFEVAFLTISCLQFLFELWKYYDLKRVWLQNKFNPIVTSSVKSWVQECIGHIS